jgi:catechol 2,3-dioxygenase-like lactoylglutathione lyase family enzyme
MAVSLWESIANSAQAVESSADFPTECRLHISLNVSNLEQSVRFYRVFLGIDPVKYRKGYAKFSVAEPPLNLSINEFPNEIGQNGHFGVQLNNTRFIREAYGRFQAAGLKLVDEVDVACCYAVQTKFWAADPDGYRWEMFVTTEPEAIEGCGPDCICHVDFERSYVTA